MPMASLSKIIAVYIGTIMESRHRKPETNMGQNPPAFKTYYSAPRAKKQSTEPIPIKTKNPRSQRNRDVCCHPQVFRAHHHAPPGITAGVAVGAYWLSRSGRPRKSIRRVRCHRIPTTSGSLCALQPVTPLAHRFFCIFSSLWRSCLFVNRTI